MAINFQGILDGRGFSSIKQKAQISGFMGTQKKEKVEKAKKKIWWQSGEQLNNFIIFNVIFAFKKMQMYPKKVFNSLPNIPIIK